MKRRRMIFTALVVFALVIFSVGNSFALEVKAARIDLIGVAVAPAGRPPISLTDTAATPAWTGSRQFFISDAIGNAGLAAALTAFSMDKEIWVVIAGTGTAGSLVTNIYVRR